MDRRSEIFRTAINAATAFGLAACGALLFGGWKYGFFASPDRLRLFLEGLGFLAPVVFAFIQAIQVVIPILPGGIGCVAGVIAFGPLWGFALNYIGICAGSLAAFLLAKRYGRAFVQSVTKEKQFTKYENWLKKGNKFDWLFAIAIFFPVAPDDLLCYLAGLTEMSIKRFIIIILLGKPLALWLYSMGVTNVLIWIFGRK